MRFAIIGAGNVGYGLGTALVYAGHDCVAVASRNPNSAAKLAHELSAPLATGSVRELPPADLIFLTVPDDALETVVRHLQSAELHNAIICHTAGSIPVDVLHPLGENIGVFYPMQTFTYGRRVNFKQVPLFLEAEPGIDLTLGELANSLSDNVRWADSNQRAQIHAGAVFAANFVNFMMLQADTLAKDVPGADYSIYLPLIREVVDKLHELPPHSAQTGPAVRGDTRVIERHIAALESAHPDAAELYRVLTDAIVKRFG